MLFFLFCYFDHQPKQRRFLHGKERFAEQYLNQESTEADKGREQESEITECFYDNGGTPDVPPLLAIYLIIFTFLLRS